MATGVIHCSVVVSSSAGRRNLCDSLADHTLIAPKTKATSVDCLLPPSANSSSTCCACLRCQSVRKPGHTYVQNTCEPVEYKDQPLSAGSLGTLSAKQSPIFGRGSSINFSLRTATPSYAERKPQIDLCAIEAEEKKEIHTARSNMDINRNNGYLYNGVSMPRGAQMSTEIGRAPANERSSKSMRNCSQSSKVIKEMTNI